MPNLGERRICFAAHSTGGQVVKQALILASFNSRSNKANAVVRRCFGVSFFGSPHYGSTILSEDIHKENIARLLHLHQPMDELLRADMSSDNFADHENTNRNFSMATLGFKKIWSFVEGQPTTLTVTGAPLRISGKDDTSSNASSANRATTFFQTPIVDRRSAVLSTSEIEIGVEEVIELDCRHDQLPFFGGQHQSSAYRNFIDELSALALELSGREAQDLEDLSKQMLTEVNLFYESDQIGHRSFVKLWSESPTLYDLCEKGPHQCLEDRRIEMQSTFSAQDPQSNDAQTASGGKNKSARGRRVWHALAEAIAKTEQAQGGATNDGDQNSTDNNEATDTPTAPENHVAVPEIVVTFVEPSDNVEASEKEGQITLAQHELNHRETSSATGIEAESVDSSQEHGDTIPKTAHPSKRSDPYAVMMREFEEYYNEDAPDVADFFAPSDLKSSSESNHVMESATLQIVQRPNSDPDSQRYHKDRTVDFSIPSVDRVKFRWIHVPTNNMLFCPAVLQALAIELREPALQRALLHRRSFNMMQHVPRHASPHGRFMIPSCTVFLPAEQQIRALPAQGLWSPTKTEQLALFFPYLHWDTLGDLKSRNALSRRRKAQNKAYPMETDVLSSCLEHRLLWFYLNNASDLPLHLRRSLDQYGYPNLSNTSARDLDQVLSKRTRLLHKQSRSLHTRLAQLWDKERDKAGKMKFWESNPREQEDIQDRSRVLMVDTMWLWIVDQGSVMTFYPTRRHGRRSASDENFNASDVHDRIYNDVNGDPRFARQCQSCFDFAALSILHASTALLEDNDDPDLQIFGIFEEYLSELTEQQTTSFKQFRDSQLVAETNEGADAIRGMMANLHNRADLTALLELRDISDELRTLDKLFADQIKVIDQMILIYVELQNYQKDSIARARDSEQPWTSRHVVSHAAVAWLDDAKKHIIGYEHQSKDMQQRCDSVQEAYKLLLDMKQKQANVAEASLSRLSAEVASEQNRAIMIFTIFTIIFLPLSFFTSLFGMNVREWSGESTNPDFREVFLIMGCLSAGLVVVALTIAFNRPIRDKIVAVLNRSVRHWPSKILKIGYRKVFASCYGKHDRSSAKLIPHDVEHLAGGSSHDGKKTPSSKVHKLNTD